MLAGDTLIVRDKQTQKAIMESRRQREDPRRPRPYGHVFVLLADITRLSCDAVAIPRATSSGRPAAFWYSWPSGLLHAKARTTDLSRHVARVDFEPSFDKMPQRYLVSVSGGRSRIVEFVTSNAIDFVEAATKDLQAQGHAPRNGRPCYLLATPVLGTGGGGGFHLAGAVGQSLLDGLQQAAIENKVDVAIVTIERDVFAALQAVRQQQKWCPMLPKSLLREAKRLADYALRGKLVLFLGAGVSCGAGLPTWSQLLENLAAEVGLHPNRRPEAAQQSEEEKDEKKGNSNEVTSPTSPPGAKPEDEGGNSSSKEAPGEEGGFF